MPKYPTLTEIVVRAAKKPERGQVTLWDGALKQFGVRISQGGAKSFIVLLGSGRRRTIGRYPTISLAQARACAKEILAEHTLGRHRLPSVSWDTARAAFLAECTQKNRPRTVEDYTRLLKRHFPFGHRPIADITKSDITQRTDRLVARPAEQIHGLIAAKVFLNWAVRRGYLDHSPCDGLRHSKGPARERVLTDTELRVVLRTAVRGRDTFSSIVALLVLTGQRRGEIASLRWEWIDRNASTITIPSNITKNKRRHTFPFGELVASLIDHVPQKNEYIFPAIRTHRKGKPTASFNGWSTSKRAFDRKCPIPHWTLHDLRRTFATGLAGLGTPPHVVERLLNHASGKISGVAAIYNRFSYMQEMREALSRWDAHLMALLASERTALGSSAPANFSDDVRPQLPAVPVERQLPRLEQTAPLPRPASK